VKIRTESEIEFAIVAVRGAIQQAYSSGDPDGIKRYLVRIHDVLEWVAGLDNDFAVLLTGIAPEPHLVGRDAPHEADPSTEAKEE
jgi:hypothetical protein